VGGPLHREWRSGESHGSCDFRIAGLPKLSGDLQEPDYLGFIEKGIRFLFFRERKREEARKMGFIIAAMVILSAGLVFGPPNRRIWVPVRVKNRRYRRF
jgi:hypothetical protein